NQHSSHLNSAVYMTMLGVGIGMTMQVLVLAVQNEAPPHDIGVATSTASFARYVGASVGVATFGALFSSRLTSLVGRSAVDLTPEKLRHLPAHERAVTAHAFAVSITHVFRVAVPLAAFAFVLTWFLKETALRTASASARRAMAVEL